MSALVDPVEISDCAHVPFSREAVRKNCFSQPLSFVFDETRMVYLA